MQARDSFDRTEAQMKIKNRLTTRLSRLSLFTAIALMIALAFYTLYARMTQNIGWSSSSNSRGARWGGGRRGGGGGGGPNIRGVNDLPCDPKGGWRV